MTMEMTAAITATTAITAITATAMTNKFKRKTLPISQTIIRHGGVKLPDGHIETWCEPCKAKPNATDQDLINEWKSHKYDQYCKLASYTPMVSANIGKVDLQFLTLNIPDTHLILTDGATFASKDDLFAVWGYKTFDKKISNFAFSEKYPGVKLYPYGVDLNQFSQADLEQCFISVGLREKLRPLMGRIVMKRPWYISHKKWKLFIEPPNLSLHWQECKSVSHQLMSIQYQKLATHFDNKRKIMFLESKLPSFAEEPFNVQTVIFAINRQRHPLDLYWPEEWKLCLRGDCC